jgi:hypothetical protein
MAKQVSIDFTNVKEGGNFSKKHMPEGDYLAKVTKVEDAKSKEGGDHMWLFTIQLKNTPSATYPHYCKTGQANQFWKIRNLLVAAGLNVPKKKLKVDPSKVVGKMIAVSLQDTEYDGKEQSEVGAVFSPQDLDEDQEPDEEEETEEETEDEEEVAKPKKKKKKGKKGKSADEVSDDDLEELEIDEL